MEKQYVTHGRVICAGVFRPRIVEKEKIEKNVKVTKLLNIQGLTQEK